MKVFPLRFADGVEINRSDVDFSIVRLTLISCSAIDLLPDNLLSAFLTRTELSPSNMWFRSVMRY